MIFLNFINQRILLRISQKYQAANHHIRVISEGSCHTEDWSNDALQSDK